MSQPNTQPEPSMEEILASIRRIISEEEAAPAKGEVLDLVERADPPGGDVDDLLVFDAEPEEPPPALTVEADASVARAPVAPPVPREVLVSQVAASATSGALGRLAGALRIAETQGQTLEGMVREMLQPLLREWLDAHLPAIVEAKVEAELERIARLAR